MNISEAMVGDSLWHEPPRPSFVRRTLRIARRQPIATCCAVLLVVVVGMAVFAGTVAPYNPTKNDVGEVLSGPSFSHLFGTDQYGRDVFSRIVHGSRTSLFVGLASTAIAVFLATVIGITSAQLSGLVDQVIQRIVDATLAIPALILVIATIVTIGPSAMNLSIVIGVRSGIGASRLIRSNTLQLMPLPFIEAAQVTGASNLRIGLRHLLPNIVPLAIVVGSTTIGANVLAEASLSFLGYGVPPPNPTLGGMLGSDSRLYMLVNPVMFVAPAISLGFIVFAVNMLGDAVRDELDPRLRGR